MRFRNRRMALVVLPLTAALLLIWSFVSHDRFVCSLGANSWGVVNCNGRLQLRVIHRAMPSGFKHLRGLGAGDQRGIWENDGVVLRSWGIPGFEWHHGGISSRKPLFNTPPSRFSCTYSTFAVSHLLIFGVTLVWAGIACYRMRRMKSDPPEG